MTTPNAALGSKLKRARGLRTQQEIADAAGITVRHLIRLESGLHIPTDRVIARLSLALGEPVESFQDAPGRDRASASREAA